MIFGMGWTVSYQLVRDAALTDDERDALVKLVNAEDRRGYDAEGFRLAVARLPGAVGVLACGMSKLGGGLEDRDARQMVAAINAAHAVLPGSELRLSDDLEVFGIEDGRCSLTGVPTAELVEDVGELVAVRELTAATVPEPLAGLLARLARGEPLPAQTAALDARLIKLAFATIKTLKYDDPSCEPIKGLLRRVPRDRLIERGFKDLKTILNNPAISVFYDAVDAVDDVAPLVTGFLTIWRKPAGLYWYGDLGFSQRTWDQLARDPRVIAQMTADLEAVTLEADEMVHRRAERSARVLARSGDPEALRAVIGLVRRWRLDRLPMLLEYHARNGAIRALCEHGGAAGYATVALEIERERSVQRRGDLARGLARLDSARAAPIVARLIDGTGGHLDLARAAASIGGADGAAMLARIAALPLARLHDWIPRLCRDHGIEPPPLPPLPPDEERVVHPVEEVRDEALEALIERRERGLFVALVWAEALHRALQARERGSSSAPGWKGWEDLLPEKIRRTTTVKQLAWAAGDGAKVLGPQTSIAALVPVQQAGLPVTLAAFPPALFRFSDDERAGLLAEEAALVEGAPR
jgi:hypothetical protein